MPKFYQKVRERANWQGNKKCGFKSTEKQKKCGTFNLPEFHRAGNYKLKVNDKSAVN